MFKQAPSKLKQAYKKTFSLEDPDNLVVIDHLLDWAGLTRYSATSDHDELIRVNERQRFVHSLFHQILDCNIEDIRKKILQRAEAKLEEQYNVAD